MNRGDRWFWAGQPHGQYTVKDAYRKFMGEADSALGFSNWGCLWKIPVAMKVKVCLWRALRADGVWRSLHIGGDRNLTFGAWFQRQSEVCTLDGLQIVAWTIWALWKTRNTAVWERRVVCCSVLWMQAFSRRLDVLALVEFFLPPRAIFRQRVMVLFVVFKIHWWRKLWHVVKYFCG
ncbi:unnamed protein product [Cuscuta campestris]|uniref:Reverse transcriptase zinc-binding domain-containing protein n=1 Tax=Cuscuta campestris TaxID=132261 RepID=A0A484LFW6_9ASTE|nr:unnamed protein product [Cuscuta campestris]